MARRARARRARRDRRARGALLREGRWADAARPGTARGRLAAEERAAPMVSGIVALAGMCVALGVAPGLLFGPLVGLAPWSRAAPATRRPAPPGNRLAADARDRARRSSRSRRVLLRSADAGAPPRRRPGPADSSSSRPLRLDERGLHEAASARARGRAAPGTRVVVARRAAACSRKSRTPATCPI